MKKERDAISEVIQRIRQKVSRCEFFPARAESPETVCLKESKSCDVFIGIYKKKYGFIPTSRNPNHISVTEMEYNEAKKAKKPILIFYHENSERDPELEVFLDKAKHFSKGHYIQKYKSISELKYLVLHALIFNLTNNGLLDKKEILFVEKLIPDLIRYKKFLLDTFEFDSTSGISRPSALIQYNVNELFIPPQISKYVPEEKVDSKKEEQFGFKTLRILEPGMSWKKLAKVAYELEKSDNKITTGIDIFDKLKNEKPTVFLGEPGSGKSTLMAVLSIDLIKKSEILPIYISIRDLANRIRISKNTSVIDYLDEKHRDLGLDKNFFLKRLHGGSCVIIFDGLDEVWEVQERKQVNDIIQNFSSFWSEQNKIFVTSRIRGYFQNPLLGNYEIFTLDPFNSEKISEFVFKWALLLEKQKTTKPDLGQVHENAEQLKNLIFGDSNLQKLAKIPLVLYILCLAFMKNMTFPKRKHWLYNILLETLLSTRETRKGIVLTNLDLTDFIKILRKVSFWMFTNNKSQIDEKTLVKLIRAKLEEEGITKFENYSIKDILTRLEDRSGILVSDGIGNYHFPHISFLEYFVALELTEVMDFGEIYDFFKPKLHNHKNLEIIIFISSILSDQSRPNASGFLEKILMTKTIHEDLHLLDLLLVIRCMSDGALVSSEFKKEIFKTIDICWTTSRNHDYGFLRTLDMLSSSGYEKEITDIWRNKFKLGNSNFKTSPLSISILSKSNNLEELVLFCKFKNSKSSAQKFFAFLILTEFMTSRPTKQLVGLITRILDQIFIPYVGDALILPLAKFCKNDQSLKNMYFNALSNTKKDYLKQSMIQYAYLIDTRKALAELNKLPKNDSNESFKKSLLGRKSKKTKSISAKQRRLDMLDDIVKENTSSEIILHELKREITLMKEFDEEYCTALINTLKIIHKNKKKIARTICLTIGDIIERFEDSKPFVKKNLYDNEVLQTKWFSYLQGINFRILSNKESAKKNILTVIKDSNEDKEIRKDYLELYLDNFSTSQSSKQLLISLLDDKELLGVILHFMVKNPKIMNEYVSKIVSLCNTTKGWLFGSAIAAIRQYIINSHS